MSNASPKINGDKFIYERFVNFIWYRCWNCLDTLYDSVIADHVAGGLLRDCKMIAYLSVLLGGAESKKAAGNF
jgi:hypothetical protein